MTTATATRFELIEALVEGNPYKVPGRAYTNWVAGAYSAIAQESPPLDTDPTAKHQGYEWGQKYTGGTV